MTKSTEKVLSDSSALTPALEDYLEAIYTLQKVKEVVKIGDISEHLKVTMASVTGGIRRLAAMDFVIYEKWRKVQLTDKGERIAQSVSRRHEDLYAFYHHVLGAEKNLAEKSACKVEHVLDPNIIERITFLSRWLQDLPDEIAADFKTAMAAQFEKHESVSEPLTLDRIEPGQKVVVSKINIKGELKQRLLDMGVNKGTEIEVIRVAPLGDPVHVKIKGYNLSLRKSEAKKITIAE